MASYPTNYRNQPRKGRARQTVGSQGRSGAFSAPSLLEQIIAEPNGAEVLSDILNRSPLDDSIDETYNREDRKGLAAKTFARKGGGGPFGRRDIGIGAPFLKRLAMAGASKAALPLNIADAIDLATRYRWSRSGKELRIPAGFGWEKIEDCGSPWRDSFIARFTYFPRQNCLGGQALQSHTLPPPDDTTNHWYEPSNTDAPPGYDGHVWVHQDEVTFFIGAGYWFSGNRYFDHDIHLRRPPGGGVWNSAVGVHVVPLPKVVRASRYSSYVFVGKPDWRLSAAPERRPLVGPSAAPAPLPFHLMKYRGTDRTRDPIEQAFRSNVVPGQKPAPKPRPGAKPGDVPAVVVTTTITVSPGAKVAPELKRDDNGVHRHERPDKDTWERKPRPLRRFYKVVTGAVGTITEGLDMLDAFHDALPKKLQAQPFPCTADGEVTNRHRGGKAGHCAPTPQMKAQALLDHYEELSPEKVVINIVKMQVEDFVIGKLGSAVKEQSKRSLDRLNRPVGFSTGPAL